MTISVISRLVNAFLSIRLYLKFTEWLRALNVDDLRAAQVADSRAAQRAALRSIAYVHVSWSVRSAFTVVYSIPLLTNSQYVGNEVEPHHAANRLHSPGPAASSSLVSAADV